MACHDACQGLPPEYREHRERPPGPGPSRPRSAIPRPVQQGAPRPAAAPVNHVECPSRAHPSHQTYVTHPPHSREHDSPTGATPHDPSGEHHDSHRRADATFSRPHPGLNKTFISIDQYRVPCYLPSADVSSPESTVERSGTSTVCSEDLEYSRVTERSEEDTFYRPGPMFTSTMNSAPDVPVSYYEDSRFPSTLHSDEPPKLYSSSWKPKRPARHESSSIHSSDVMSAERSHHMPHDVPSFPDPDNAHPHHTYPGGRRAQPRRQEHGGHHSHGHHEDGRRHDGSGRHHGALGQHHGGFGDDGTHDQHEMSSFEQEVNELINMNVLGHENVDGHFFHEHDEHPLDLSRSQVISVVSLVDYEASHSDAGCHCDGSVSSDPDWTAALFDGLELSVFDPLYLNATLSPRSMDWNEHRRFLYGSVVEELLELEEEESREASMILEDFQTSRRGDLNSTMNETT